jgi:hypothetical protein
MQPFGLVRGGNAVPAAGRSPGVVSGGRRLRPLPSQQTAGKRCADGCFPKSPPTSRAKLCAPVLSCRRLDAQPSGGRARPYHESCAHRCADPGFCRSLATVGRQVMCSTLAGCQCCSPAFYGPGNEGGPNQACRGSWKSTCPAQPRVDALSHLTFPTFPLRLAGELAASRRPCTLVAAASLLGLGGLLCAVPGCPQPVIRR